MRRGSAGRQLLRAAGLVLIGVVLYVVGWRDRVTTSDGRDHVGRVVSQDAETVLLRTERGEIALPASEVSATRRGLRGALETLLERPWWAAGGVLAHLLAILACLLRWRTLLAGAGLTTRMGTVVRLGWLGLFLSNVLPGGLVGGDVVRSAYAAGVHPERKTEAILSVFMDRLLGLVALCGVAAVAVLLAPPASEVALARGLILALLGGGAAAAAVLYSTPVRRFLRLSRLLDRLPFSAIVLELRRAMAVYGARPGAAAGAFLLALVSHVLVLGAFFLYGGALGNPLPLLAVGVAIPVAQMVSAVPALPGGWGVGDAAFLFFLPAAGVPAAQAVALSFLYRAVHTLISLPGGLLLALARRPAPD